MAESHCSSLKESWKKPNKSIKLVVKKRVNHPVDKYSNALKARGLNATEVTTGAQLKRRNPFGCSPHKKANISRPHENQENVKLFQDLDKPKSSSYTEHINTVEETGEFIPDINGQVKEIDKPSTKEVQRNCLSSKNLPMDWSLKTRVRFTSHQSFNWCSKMLGSQEAEGICNFVQCQENLEKTANQVPSTLFQQNIMYWIHPCLPWLSLFPRLSSEIKSMSKLSSMTENDDIADALQANWCQSFRSLFNLLRCGYCNYFYLCSAQSTMLFRAANIGGLPSTSVFITPTTKGIRDALDKEGISYTLPALGQSKSSSSDDDDDDENEKDKNNPLNVDFGEDNETSWLESMGVGKETLPQLKQSKINQQRVKLRNIDHHGSSVAVVTGSDTQALFNYLLNCKSLVAKTGNLAGIPPTLLAPVAFEGATLQSLLAKQGIIKQGKHLNQQHNLDITGPILPGMFSKLCQVFETAQDRQFSVATKVLQPTTPFNVTLPDIKTEQSTRITERNFLEQCSSLGVKGLTYVKYENDLYSWETNA